MKISDRAYSLESRLGCECCCFMWDAERLSDMEALCTVCGLESKQQAGWRGTTGGQSAGLGGSAWKSVYKGSGYVLCCVRIS